MPNDALLFATNLAKEYFDPSRGYQVRGLCDELAVKPARFARLTHRRTESVSKLFSGKFVQPKEAKTRDVLRQMYQIVAIFRSMGWSSGEMSRWMNAPLPTDEGQTPLELIEHGHGQDLIDRLVALAIGNVGS